MVNSAARLSGWAADVRPLRRPLTANQCAARLLCFRSFRISTVADPAFKPFGRTALLEPLLANMAFSSMATKSVTAELIKHASSFGRGLQDDRCAICARQSWTMAQSQMAEPARVHHRRLGRAGRITAASGRCCCVMTPMTELTYAGRVGTGMPVQVSRNFCAGGLTR